VRRCSKRKGRGDESHYYSLRAVAHWPDCAFQRCSCGQRHRRIQLLLADFALCFRCQPRRKLGSFDGLAALSTRGIRSVCRLRFLSGKAEQAVQPKAERGQFCTALGVRLFCVRVDFLPAGTSERCCQFPSPVNP
jgi:hypothetical protein